MSTPSSGNKTYTPYDSQSFLIPFDSYLGLFTRNPITKYSDYSKIKLECSNFVGTQMQFVISKYIGYSIYDSNISLCINTYGYNGYYLSDHEIYITDVMSTGNYSWPYSTGNPIKPITNIFDIYNSTNGFFGKFEYMGDSYVYGSYYPKYCLQDEKIYNFFDDAFYNSSNFTLGITMLMENPF